MAQVIDISIKSNIATATKDTQNFASALEGANKDVENLNSNLSIQNGVINSLEKELVGMEAKLRDTPKTGAAGFYALEKAIASTKDELKLEKIGLKELNQEMKTAQGVQKKYVKEISNQEKAQKKATAATKKGTKANKLLAKAGKLVGKAFKAMGIGLLVAVLAALFKAMSKNEKIMRAVEKVTATVSAVFSQVVDVLVDVYEWVTASGDRFDGLTKVISGLMTIALTPLKLAFYAIKLVVQEVALAWEKTYLETAILVRSEV